MSVDLNNLKMEDVKFVYFRKNGGTITVAYLIPNIGEKGTRRVIFDFASCNPKDRFNKKLGRNMAFGRLVKRMKKLTHYDIIDGYSDLEFEDNPNQGLYKQTVEHVYNDLLSGDFDLPKWFYGSVKQLKAFENNEGSKIASLIQGTNKFNRAEASYLKSLIDSKTYLF